MTDFQGGSQSLAFPAAADDACATPLCFHKSAMPSQEEQHDNDVQRVHDAGPGVAADGAAGGGEHPHQQEHAATDFVTSTLRQVLATDMETFLRQEVAPRSAAIAEDMVALQYEADLLSSKAAADKAAVLMELDRLHQLVASFQAQIMNVFQ